ncbi:MAG: hypothetical protein KKD17_03420 [Nanoarchaeota archaeon]|nr:hypothetical protein [Nanoarchaeota archaeon]
MICAYSAGAVGIAGLDTNRRELFVPGSVYEFNYELVAGYVINDYTVSATGGLAKYVVLDRTSFENVSPGSRIPFYGRIIFPSEIDPPGWHLTYICVEEGCTVKGTVCGRASACAGLNFMVLYPGINPVVSLSAPNVNRDQAVSFKVSVNNLGKDDIASCAGTIDVFDLQRTKAGVAQVISRPVKSAETVQLDALFNTAGLLPGNYTATADIDCDGTIKDANASFRIGTLDVKIVDYTKELETGGIKRFVTKVESVWNDPLDAYAEIVIFDSNSSVTAKTSTNKLQPWKTLDLEAFVDTSKLEEKEYSVKINVFYAEKSSVFEGKIRMVAPQPGAVAEAVPSAAEQEAPQKSGISTTALTIILVIVVVILTAVNIFLAIYRKKKE